MRIGLTYDLQTDPADARQAEFDPPATLAALTRALEALGHQVAPLGNAAELARRPQRLRDVALVFNVAEGEAGRCREAWVPTLLELFGVPYVGSGPLALALGLDKLMSKRLAAADGLPTPRWVSVAHPAALPARLPFGYPAIVKPRFDGSGRGVDAGAVVHTRDALLERSVWLVARCPQPLLVEEFIPHGELTVFVIGNTPPVAYPSIQRPLDPTSRLSCHVVRPPPAVSDCPLELDDALDAEARRLAGRMFDAIGCRDLARIDLRVDARGRLFVLEINPLPSLDPETGLGFLAEYLGTTYTALVGQILDAALRRLDVLAPCASARWGQIPHG